ncbi:MAG TPA: alkaline phosphatase family protein [Longimicrobiaceae bacterium]|nr:alkaline phosphatase family protein [Longimicrobiaceae bacterium]
MRRWIGWVLGAMLALAAGAYAYLKLSGNAPEELAELMGEGGEQVLRQPMRPARGAPRVLLFALDGVGEGELNTVLRAGRMPHLARLLGPETAEPGVYRHAYAVPGVLSILPSSTFPAWASAFTGEPVSRTGIAGNEWFAREEARFYAPIPGSVTGHEHTLELYSDSLAGRALRVPTLYERAGVRSYVSLSGIFRGADLVTVPDAGALGDLASALAKGLTSDEPVSREVYAEVDSTSVATLEEAVRRHGVADLQVVYFPGVDLFTHVAPQPLPDQMRYLTEVIDPLIGRVVEMYRRAGALDGTYVVLVADHGHTPVPEDDRHSLQAEGGDEPAALLERAGFRVRPFEVEVDEDEEDFQAVLAFQGAFAYVYLADRSTCPRPGDRCDWRRPPRLDADVLPVARAFHQASATGAGLPALRGALDLVFARPPRAPGEDALPFQVWDGARLVPVEAYLAAHPRPDLLELAPRLEALSAGPYGHRAGDVLLLARSGLERPVGERFYFAAEYRSWHGSPSAQDSRIPLLVAHPGRSGGQLRDEVRRAVGERPSQLAVTPLVLALLGRGGGAP